MDIRADAEQPAIVAGVDDGFGMTKVVVIGGPNGGKTIAIPSRARSGIHGTTVIGEADGDAPNPCYESEGVAFTVGALSDAESARFGDYPFSPMNRVIVHHALRLAGLGGCRVKIATGLPLSTFYKGTEPNHELLTRKNDSIRTEVNALDGSETAVIVEHYTYPEGLAAWVDYAVDDNGNYVLGADNNPIADSETVGVIDIGGRTTDVAVVLPGRRIDHARCGSAEIGVLNVVEEVRVALLRAHGFEVPSSAIEAALRTRTLKMWGKPTDISGEIDAAVAQTLDAVLREVNRRLGSAIDVDKILLVGGGAHLLSRVADRYPNVQVAPNPEFANARGFAKYMNL